MLTRILERVKEASVKASLHAMARRQRGLTTVEYAVAGTLIVLAVVAAFALLGNTVAQQINDITDVIDN